MKAITLSVAQGIRGNAANKTYGAQAQITSYEDLTQAVQFDHVAGSFRNNERSNDNFISADCILMDCDNDHSDNPGEWLTPERLQERLPGVMFAVIHSKSHMKDKKEHTARPRFHVYYPLRKEATDAGHVKKLKEGLLAIVPEFDSNAKDAARFFYGVETPTGLVYEGAKCVDEAISFLEFLSQDEADEEAHMPPADIRRDETPTATMTRKEVYTPGICTADEGRVITQFLAFIEATGIRPLHSLQIIPDGQLHKFATQEDTASKTHATAKAGSYCLHMDGCPAGWVKDYRDRTYNFTYDFSPSERREYGRAMHEGENRKQAEIARREHEREKAEDVKLQRENEAKARDMALASLHAGTYELQENGYFRERFSSRGFVIEGLEITRYKEIIEGGKMRYDFNVILQEPLRYCTASIPGSLCQRGELLVPFINITTGAFQTLQRISTKPDSQGKYHKQFYTGLTPTGAAHIIMPHNGEEASKLYVCEGIATALALFVLINGAFPVYSAGPVDNLAPVCEALKTKYPIKKIVLAADNDMAGIEAANKCKDAGLVDSIKKPRIAGHDWYDVLLQERGIIA